MLDQVIIGNRTFHSLPQCDLSNINKSEIKAYFENSYDINDSFFSALVDESVIYKCPDRLRLPLIFYYGHTACVYINKLILADLIRPEDRINLKFETIFETGVDEMSWDDTENYRMGGKFQWPELDDVIAYRRQVRQLILDIIEKTPLELPITMDSPWWALFMGIEHEKIHAETSSVLIRQLPVIMVKRPKGFIYGPMEGPEIVTENPMLPVPAQDITLGKPTDFPTFGWDNEYGHRECRVSAFSASKYMITNREFYEFVKAGGYTKRDTWTDGGWRWKEYNQAIHPIFWVCDKGCKVRCGKNISDYSHCEIDKVFDARILSNLQMNGKDDDIDEYRLRCMFDVLSMPWDWPVEVNYHEAKAYCMWKGQGYRLPSEAEHHAIRNKSDRISGVGGDTIHLSTSKVNSNLQHGSSTPVNLYPPTHLGFHDVMGNAWEWTEDQFNGLPGFKTCYLYDDYSFTSFDGRHNNILGGSWCSTGAGASRFARYGFRRHFVQHCGFRLVRAAQSETQKETICIIRTLDHDVIDHSATMAEELKIEPVSPQHSYCKQDSDKIIQKHIALEYGDKSPTLCCLQTIQTWLKQYGTNTRRFLHLGCGAGHLSFKLSALCDELLALDTSSRLVDLCSKLKSGNDILCNIKDCVHIISAPLIDTNNIIFKQFSWLPNEVGFFDMVVATFFDRTENVLAWTSRLREVIRDQGILVVVSGGQWTEDNLTPLLNKYFKLMDVCDVATLDLRNLRMTSWMRQ